MLIVVGVRDDEERRPRGQETWWSWHAELERSYNSI